MTTKVRSKTKEVVPPAPPLALNDALLAAMRIRSSVSMPRT